MPTLASRVVLALVLTFLIGPFVIIILAGLSAGNSLAFPPDGLSLKWYLKVFTVESFQASFALSMFLAVFGTLAALAGFVLVLSTVDAGHGTRAGVGHRRVARHRACVRRVPSSRGLYCGVHRARRRRAPSGGGGPAPTGGHRRRWRQRWRRRRRRW